MARGRLSQITADNCPYINHPCLRSPRARARALSRGGVATRENAHVSMTYSGAAGAGRRAAVRVWSSPRSRLAPVACPDVGDAGVGAHGRQARRACQDGGGPEKGNGRKVCARAQLRGLGQTGCPLHVGPRRWGLIPVILCAWCWLGRTRTTARVGCVLCEEKCCIPRCCPAARNCLQRSCDACSVVARRAVSIVARRERSCEAGRACSSRARIRARIITTAPTPGQIPPRARARIHALLFNCPGVSVVVIRVRERGRNHAHARG